MINNIIFFIQTIGILFGYMVIGVLIQFISVQIYKRCYKQNDYDATLFIAAALLWPFFLLFGPIVLLLVHAMKWISKITGTEFNP